jgi:hypothetical protein
MKTVILITERASGPWPFEVVDTFGPAYWTQPNRKATTLGEHWLAVTHADSIENDYEPDEWASVRARFTDPSVYLVESNSEREIAEFIVRAARISKGLIDNDCGWTGWLDDYAAAIEAGQPWLYSDQAPRQA